MDSCPLFYAPSVGMLRLLTHQSRLAGSSDEVKVGVRVFITYTARPRGPHPSLRQAQAWEGPGTGPKRQKVLGHPFGGTRDLSRSLVGCADGDGRGWDASGCLVSPELPAPHLKALQY
eukprot:341889-Pyramimonas_sp.AAC.1